MRTQDELDEYVTRLIEDRRSRPADDLLTALIAAEEDGDRLSPSELVSMVEAVIVGGTDTTRNQLGCTVALFAEPPRPVGAAGRAAGARGPRRRGVHALPGRHPGHRPLRVRGHRVPRRRVPRRHLRLPELHRRQLRPERVRRPPRVRHHGSRRPPRRSSPSAAASTTASAPPSPGPSSRRRCPSWPGGCPTWPWTATSRGSRRPSASGARCACPSASRRPEPLPAGRAGAQDERDGSGRTAVSPVSRGRPGGGTALLTMRMASAWPRARDCSR